MLYVVFLPLANLTGHTERVGMENFELLKVLGTGGNGLYQAYTMLSSCYKTISNVGNLSQYSKHGLAVVLHL